MVFPNLSPFADAKHLTTLCTTPLQYESTPFPQKIGVLGMLTIAVGAYALRFVGFCLLSNPWYVQGSLFWMGGYGFPRLPTGGGGPWEMGRRIVYRGGSVGTIAVGINSVGKKSVGRIFRMAGRILDANLKRVGKNSRRNNLLNPFSRERQES